MPLRALSAEEEAELSDVIQELDHFTDVLQFSSSIPRFLPARFFEVKEEIEGHVDEIWETRQVESRFVLDYVAQEMLAARRMMNAAKQKASVWRALFAPGHRRPPAVRPLRPETKATEAMAKAEKLNVALDALENRDKNLTKLKFANCRFFVVGFAANGQGDTAFIVRLVTLLRDLGLDAHAVKPKLSAHDQSASFNAVAQFFTTEQVRDRVREGDFIIEGPLSDPHPQETWGQTFFTVHKHRFLRLYEYGTLTYRGGQAQQHASSKTSSEIVNVVTYADRIAHAFMGMGCGEIGAFFNSKALRTEQGLGALARDRESLAVCEAIAALLEKHRHCDVFVGYANDCNEAFGWGKKVCAAQLKRKRAAHSLIIAVFGGKSVDVQQPTAAVSFVRSNDRGTRVESLTSNAEASCTLMLADYLPSTTMTALQRVAQPFTCATGNYSLSEAIENGHLAVYETLNFNAGVQVAYEWQVKDALQRLEVDATLGAAIQALVATSPSQVDVDAVCAVLSAPQVLSDVMAVVRGSTDITALMLARLAALI
jgi:hypothetical protein